MGGVIVAIGGIGSILMLSSVSAPSRVPHVVCLPAVSHREAQECCGSRNVPP
jgi:hypothetical protein